MTGPHANPYAGRAPAHLWKTAMARAPGGQVAPPAGQAFRLPAGDPDRGCAARGGRRRGRAFLSYSYFFWCRMIAGPLIDVAALAAARAAFPDYLAQGIVWPVYPEVAAHHGIAATPDRWRISADRPNCTHFGLDAMIARTFAQLADQTANRDKIITMMGGAEKVALYAGR